MDKKNGRWVKHESTTKKSNKSTGIDKQIHKGWKTYEIHDNGGRPFLVAIKGNSKGSNVVRIYKMDPKIKAELKWDEMAKPYQYAALIKEYHPKKIFIGKSPKNPMTEFSLGYGKKFDGNSILLELKEKYRYVYIGSEIYEFSIPSDDKIIKYWSPVGNNDVPYPVAIGELNAYFMLESDKSYVPLSKITEICGKLTANEMTDLYNQYFFGIDHNSSKALKKYAKKMKKTKIIHKRIW